MSIVTAWTNPTFSVQLVQLSDDPEDGTPQEQITYLATLPYLEGFSCIDADYTGTAPETDASLWRWSDGAIVAVTPVPSEVSPRQVRLLLLSQGLLDQVETMIAAQDRATQIAWQYAEVFKRNDPLLVSLGAGLGLTDAQIDQFFITASAI